MLGVADEIDGPLSGLSQLLVARHRVGFAQGERRQPLGVHGALLQIASVERDLLPGKQIVQPPGHGLSMSRFAGGSDAGPQERQQCQGSRPRGRPHAAGVAALPPERSGVMIEMPGAIFQLGRRQPLQSQVHGGLALGSPALRTEHLSAEVG